MLPKKYIGMFERSRSSRANLAILTSFFRRRWRRPGACGGPSSRVYRGVWDSGISRGFLAASASVILKPQQPSGVSCVVSESCGSPFQGRVSESTSRVLLCLGMQGSGLPTWSW